tara:strand:- start:460 stop:870 length:411 start_codon:yes stop_codon:yes gene_type:complete
MLKFHHVGVATKDINKSVEQFKQHFHESISFESEVVFDPEQNASLKIITLEDGSSTEFISGKMVEGLVKRKVDLYHVCYESSDFGNDTANLASNGAIPISKKKPAVLFGGRHVQFFMTGYGMVEVLESIDEYCAGQ